MKKKLKLSKISLLHFGKLIGRSLLFLGAAAVYLAQRIQAPKLPFDQYKTIPWLFALIWVIFVVEMALRFFPSKLESPGCQKQFARNYIPTGEETPVLQSGWRTFFVAAAWLLLNGIIGALYYTGVIDRGILILICLAYGVCDMICILFFCPFQTWFMKNRCCTDCRIYNWDFAMMFTPLVFIPGIYTWTLLGLSLLLLFRWELTFRLHPKRFSEQTNAGIRCANCKEKLCHHKKQLKHLIKNVSNRRKKESNPK